MSIYSKKKNIYIDHLPPRGLRSVWLQISTHQSLEIKPAWKKVWVWSPQPNANRNVGLFMLLQILTNAWFHKTNLSNKEKRSNEALNKCLAGKKNPTLIKEILQHQRLEWIQNRFSVRMMSSRPRDGSRKWLNLAQGEVISIYLVCILHFYTIKNFLSDSNVTLKDIKMLISTLVQGRPPVYSEFIICDY